MKVTGLRPGLGKDRADPTAEGGTILCPEELSGRPDSQAGHKQGIQGGSCPDGQSCQARFQAKRSMTIYSLDVLLFLFGTSLLFHVQF